MQTWQYGTLEWLWPAGQIRTNFGNGIEHTQAGSYNELVDLLNSLGAEGWEIAGSTAGPDWIFWTLKRPHAFQHN
jgi:hypothetical protein